MSEFLDEAHHMKIGVPPLTSKEKAVLDQLFPSENTPSEHDVEALGFNLKPSQIKSYHKYYRYYPVYGELLN